VRTGAVVRPLGTAAGQGRSVAYAVKRPSSAAPMRFTSMMGNGAMGCSASSSTVGQGRNTLPRAPNAPPTPTASSVTIRDLGTGLATKLRVKAFQHIVVHQSVGGQTMTTPRACFTGRGGEHAASLCDDGY